MQEDPARPMSIKRYVAEVYPKDEGEIENGLRRTAAWLGKLPHGGGSGAVRESGRRTRESLEVEVRSEPFGSDPSEPMSIKRYVAEVLAKDDNQAFLRLNNMSDRLHDLIERIDTNTFVRSFHDHDYTPIEPSGGSLRAPIDGELIPLSQVPDEAFASGACGVGVGIVPRGNMIVAPCGCRITAQIPSKNAVGLVTAEGVELLLSVGSSPQEYQGGAFRQLAWQNDTVVQGAPLLAWDQLAMAREGYDDTVSFIITNPQEFAGIQVVESGRVVAGQAMITVEM